ncbi:MAG: hypothetical protein PVJ19_11460 [Desulfobacteraceae bacterium]|jgi:hypothetical protein
MAPFTLGDEIGFFGFGVWFLLWFIVYKSIDQRFAALSTEFTLRRVGCTARRAIVSDATAALPAKFSVRKGRTLAMGATHDITIFFKWNMQSDLGGKQRH